jgi:ElaB/YqjD/DUF883 family membrane-anchored ribosome-binding protein
MASMTDLDRLRSSGPASGADSDSDARELQDAEAAVARTRARVAGSILALRREVTRRTDWREWVRRRPLPLLATAFALGLLLGGRAGGFRRGRRRITDGRSQPWR